MTSWRRWACTGISRSEVSRIREHLDERVEVVWGGTLAPIAFPYVHLDVTSVMVSDDSLGQAVSRAVVIATGITASGDQRILVGDIGNSENETFWTRFLRALEGRRLSGVQVVVSDAHARLKASIRTCFTGSSWQRCRVHIAGTCSPRFPGPHRSRCRSVPIELHARHRR